MDNKLERDAQEIIALFKAIEGNEDKLSAATKNLLFRAMLECRSKLAGVVPSIIRSENKSVDEDVMFLPWRHSFEVLGSFWFGHQPVVDYGILNLKGNINDGYIKENAATILSALGPKSFGLFNAGRNTRFGFVSSPSDADEQGRPTSQLNAFKTTADMNPLEFLLELYYNGSFGKMNDMEVGESISTSPRAIMVAIENESSRRKKLNAFDLEAIKTRLIPGKVVVINSDELRHINWDKALSNNLGWVILKLGESSTSAQQKLAKSSGKPVILVEL